MQEDPAGTLDCRMDGCKLLHDLAAVALAFQHVLHPADLAFNPAQAVDQFFFCLLILDLHRLTFSSAGPRPAYSYPAQLKPPLEPQLLAVETAFAELPVLKEATFEIFRRVWLPWQTGQAGF